MVRVTHHKVSTSRQLHGTSQHHGGDGCGFVVVVLCHRSLRLHDPNKGLGKTEGVCHGRKRHDDKDSRDRVSKNPVWQDK